MVEEQLPTEENKTSRKRQQRVSWQQINAWQKDCADLGQDQRIFLGALYGTLILPRVYLGSRLAALDEKWLKEHNITHILTIAIGMKPAFPKSFTYKVIKIKDHQNQNLLEHFDSTYNYIEKALASGTGNVLVHCQAGISRSASVMIAYLMKSRDLEYNEALSFITSKRSIVCPNLGFRYQLQLYEMMGCHKPKKQPQYWIFAMQLLGKTILEPLRAYGF